MGIAARISISEFPKQGNLLHRLVRVCFHFDTRHTIDGTIVRDDVEEPFTTIVELEDGRVVLGSECMFTTL